MLNYARTIISNSKLHIVDEVLVMTRTANVRQSTDMCKRVANFKTQKDCCSLFVLYPIPKVLILYLLIKLQFTINTALFTNDAEISIKEFPFNHSPWQLPIAEE